MHRLALPRQLGLRCFLLGYPLLTELYNEFQTTIPAVLIRNTTNNVSPYPTPPASPRARLATIHRPRPQLCHLIWEPWSITDRSGTDS